MQDISNKTLAITVVIVMVAVMSIMAFMFSAGPSVKFTGKASEGETGTAELELNTSVDITVVRSVDFGNGYVLANASECVLNTSGSSDSGCGNFTTANTLAKMEIENSGNVYINISGTWNATAAEFIQGTGPNVSWKTNDSVNCANRSRSDIRYLGNLTENYTFIGHYDTGTNGSHGDADVNVICDQLNYTNTGSGQYDNMTFDFAIQIPDDAQPGVRRAEVLFLAVESNLPTVWLGSGGIPAP